MFLVQIACGIYLLAVPLAYQLLGGSATAHDFARVAQLPLLAISALALLLTTRRGPQLPPGNRRLAIGLVALAVLSALSSAVPLVAARELALFGGLLAMMLVIARAVRERDLLSYFVLGAVATYSILLLLVLLATMATGRVVLVWELPLGFDNPRFFNHVQTATIPLLTAFTLRPSWSRQLRLLAFACLCLQMFLLVATTGRATMLATGGAAVLLWLLLGARARPWLWKLVLAAAAGLLLYGLLSSLGQGLAETTGYQPNARELSSAHSRDYLWTLAAQQAAASPWLGSGPMHFAHQVNAKGAHPHNFYIQLAAELGLLFVIMLLALVLRAMYAMAKQLRACMDPESSVMGAGLFAACVAIGIDALFSGNLVMPNAQVWCFAVFGMAWAWHADGSENPEPCKLATWRGAVLQRPVRLLLHCALFAAVLWLNLVSWPEARFGVPHLMVSPRSNESLELAQGMRPRFWSHGWF